MRLAVLLGLVLAARAQVYESNLPIDHPAINTLHSLTEPKE